MPDRHGGHDDRLLDALSELEPVLFDGPLWRVVREGRSVIDASRGAGRWNELKQSVLYGSELPDGAIAEMHYHLNQGQPVFPSRIRHTLYELGARMDRTLSLLDMDALVQLGVDTARYREMLYDRTREIASATEFLGFNGLIAPSARWDCNTIVIFLEGFDLDEIAELSSTPIDWRAWRQKNMRSQ